MAERLPQARGLGVALSDLLDDPESFVAALTDGLRQLSDEEYADAQEHVAPGGAAVIGVRVPLVRAVARQLRGPLEEGSSATALWLGQRLVMEEPREVWLFSLVPLAVALPSDPERTWQLLRRLGRRCRDRIAVDTLAEVTALGVVLEPVRWAELEQLVYSSSRWERRLAAASVARMPFQVPAQRRAALDGPRGVALIASLMGDADDQVQKALAWALRSWTLVDPSGVATLLQAETDHAVQHDDGHRAWVIRDALPSQRPAFATTLRRRLAGIRRRESAPSTSTASEAAAAFAGFRELSDRAVEQQGRRMSGRGIA